MKLRSPLYWLCLAWGVAGAVSAQALVELNTATEAQLDGVRGIGPALSTSMLAARNQRAFDSWADVHRRVPGLQIRKLRALSDAGLRVQGTPFSVDSGSVQAEAGR